MTRTEARSILEHPERHAIASPREAKAVWTLIDSGELPIAALFWPNPLQPPPGPPIHDPRGVHPVHPVGRVPHRRPGARGDRPPDHAVNLGEFERSGCLRPQCLPVARPHQDAPAGAYESASRATAEAVSRLIDSIREPCDPAFFQAAEPEDTLPPDVPDAPETREEVT